jgi:hypothetical protein
MKTIEIEFNDKRCWHMALEFEQKNKRYAELKDKWWKRTVLNNCGGWREEDLAVVLENTEATHNIYGDKFAPHFTHYIMSNLDAPYLVNSGAMLTSTELIPYKRNRWNEGDDIWYKVIDSEEIVIRWRKINKQLNEWQGEWVDLSDHSIHNTLKCRNVEVKETSEKMILAMNFEIMFDLFYHAKTRGKIASERNADDFVRTLAEIDESIHQKIGYHEGQHWALMAPETALSLTTDNKIKLTSFLKSEGHLLKHPAIKVYSSPLMPLNKILMGVRGENLYAGYVFQPHVVPAPCDDETLVFSYAKKLLREGSNYFAAITIK